MVETDELGDHAAHRGSCDVGFVDAIGVQDGSTIGGHVVDRVVGFARRAGGGLASVAVVVADDEASAVGQALAEVDFPEQHRGSGAHH